MAALREPPESKFGYVVVAARRARQLMGGARPLVDRPRSYKPTRVAMEELDSSALEYELPELLETEEQKESRRRKG